MTTKERTIAKNIVEAYESMPELPIVNEQFYCVIYTYTTALRKPKGRVKVGSARREGLTPLEAAKKRIAEQTTASNSDDPPIILEVFDVSDICETGKKSSSLSKLRSFEQGFIHKTMKKEKMWFAGDQDVDVKDTSEWFFADKVSTVVNRVSSLVNNKRYGVERPNAWGMRQEGIECRDKAFAHYTTAGSYQFLINAKMRFGKTFVSYQIIKSLVEHYNKKFKVLVLTYKPQVEASWEDDINNHVDFEGWKYYYAKEFTKENPVKLGNNKVEVLFASFQDLNDATKDKWKHIFNYHFDMVIIDEQHYGINTDNAQTTLNNIKHDRKLELSGTPLHALMSGKFLENEIYTWSYADEQRKRLEELLTNWKTDTYRWLPVMKFMTFKISDKAKQQCSFYESEEGFTMVKMFASDDGITFIDEAAVTMWLEEAYGINCHKNKSPVKQYNSDHMVWKLPSVNSCKAMEKLLTRLDYVKHVPIVVSGDKGANLDGVKKHIQKFDKTVTLTCGSLMTGTTVPEWDMIFMLDSGSSAQDYFQTIFRVQSMNKEARKEVCYVVDYNPQRNLKMIYEYAFVQSSANGKSTQQNLQEFLDFAPIMDHTDNKPVQKSIDDILNIITPASMIESFGNGYNCNFSKVTQDVIDILAPIKEETNSTREENVNDNDIELGKNKTNNGNRKSGTKDLAKDEKRKLQQKAVTLTKNIPNYLVLEDNSIDNIQDIVYINNTELFKREVGISIEEFEKLCNLQFLNVQRIDLRISAFQQAMKKFCNV